MSDDDLYALYQLTPDHIQRHLEFLAQVVEIVDPIGRVPVTLTDPKDDPVSYTAIAGGANILCSRDKAFHQPDVLAAASRHNLSIMNDLQLLALLERRH